MKSQRQIRTQQEKDVIAWLSNKAGVLDDGIIIRQMKIAAQKVYCMELQDASESIKIAHTASERYRVEQRGPRVLMLWPKKLVPEESI